ncbi:MAG TPA: CBS domain-containing protein [Candidatus Norongarragalinales archaeon]|jgi:CBS domain-containing protein|nr:CBS domain-containing protein [Candidatus Norongarragalinales archaeon]
MSASEYTENANVFDYNETLSKALAAMTGQNDGHVVVTRDGAYFGMMDDRTVRDFYGDPSSAKIGPLSEKAPVISKSTSEEDIIANFLNTKTKAIAVVEKNKVIGVVTRLSALKMLQNSPALSGKRVEEFMHRPPSTISNTSNVTQARKTMHDRNIYRLIVTDARGRLVGLFSSFDLATKSTAKTFRNNRESTFRPTERSRVEDDNISTIMTTNVITISPEQSLKEAVGKMLQNKILGLVVTKQDKPVGMLTARDVCTALIVSKPSAVQFSGLGAEEKFFKQALVDEADAYLQKWRKRLRFEPEDTLMIDVKGNREGQKKRYELHARMTLAGKVITAKQPNRDPHRQTWDLHMALKETLDELGKELDKIDQRKKTLRKKYTLDEVEDIKGGPARGR